MSNNPSSHQQQQYRPIAPRSASMARQQQPHHYCQPSLTPQQQQLHHLPPMSTQQLARGVSRTLPSISNLAGPSALVGYSRNSSYSSMMGGGVVADGADVGNLQQPDEYQPQSSLSPSDSSSSTASTKSPHKISNSSLYRTASPLMPPTPDPTPPLLAVSGSQYLPPLELSEPTIPLVGTGGSVPVKGRGSRKNNHAHVALPFATTREVEPALLTTTTKPTRSNRDTQRKINHSLIERRRREKINSALAELRELVPPAVVTAVEVDDGTGGTAIGGKDFKLEVLVRTVSFVKDLMRKVTSLETELDNVTSGGDTQSPYKKRKYEAAAGPSSAQASKSTPPITAADREWSGIETESEEDTALIEARTKKQKPPTATTTSSTSKQRRSSTADEVLAASLLIGLCSPSPDVLRGRNNGAPSLESMEELKLDEIPE